MFADFRCLNGDSWILTMHAWASVHPGSRSRLEIDVHGDMQEFRALYEALKQKFEEPLPAAEPAPAGPIERE